MADDEAKEQRDRQRPRDDDARPPRASSKRPSTGARKPQARSADRQSTSRGGATRKPYQRDGERKPHQRDGERKPYKREGERKPYQRTGAPRPTRGGAGRPDRAARPGESRPLRERHDEPVLPEEITARDLHPSARNELKTLSKENADMVARHLAMAARLIDEDPTLAHQHALAASRRAGRIAVVRETAAITAYATGDFALALRELRTYRRISGRDDQIALMVDSERGVGRPDRALEVGRAVDRSALSAAVRAELAIAMSGARLDLGEAERALQELEIPELDPDRAFEWSPGLFAARATVLEELGRDDEAQEWRRRALVADEALNAANGMDDRELIEIDEIDEMDVVDSVDVDAGDVIEESEASDQEPQREDES